MISKNEYPICEFDDNRNPVIRPTDFLTKSLREKCVITFFRKELNQFVAEHDLPVIGTCTQKRALFMNARTVQTGFVSQRHSAARRVRL